MVIDLLLNNKTQIGSLSTLDLLPAQTELGRLLKNYLIADKVEGKSPSTLVIYCRVAGYFIQFAHANNFPDEAASITASHVRLFLLSLQERGLAPASVNAYYRALNTFFNWLVNEGFIEKSPMQTIKPPRIPRKVVKPFSRQDIDNLLLVCSGTRFLDVRNRAMVLILLDTGLRLAELAGIQVEDINLDRETIRVMGKGAKERIVRVGKTAQKALLRYVLMRDDGYPCLWVSGERRPMTKPGIQVTIKRLCHRAGVTDARPGPHTFRHTAAISYLRNGGGEFTLQIMLGHSTLQMTRRYVSSLGAEDMINAHKLASPVDNLKLK